MGHSLNTELPLGVCSIGDSLLKILAVEIGILSSKLESLIPDKGVNAKFWSEVELDIVKLSLGIGEGVCVDTKAFASVSVACMSRH